ncbi:unnamed protein product [Ambrosiozyma monospora]|uniref:Unnamed protein product n=1 Tax=Ambrosiozyma monospora TaxID=43982 RepID=A0A9W6SVS0_AMBMO|nr:unnamed protein product [Ambrosiozyma monospora]
MFNNLFTATKFPKTLKPVIFRFILKEGKGKEQMRTKNLKVLSGYSSLSIMTLNVGCRVKAINELNDPEENKPNVLDPEIEDLTG